jgi:hypothetical protein
MKCKRDEEGMGNRCICMYKRNIIKCIEGYISK